MRERNKLQEQINRVPVLKLKEIYAPNRAITELEKRVMAARHGRGRAVGKSRQLLGEIRRLENEIVGLKLTINNAAYRRRA